jgi:hypothetical protein
MDKKHKTIVAVEERREPPKSGVFAKTAQASGGDGYSSKGVVMEDRSDATGYRCPGFSDGPGG